MLTANIPGNDALRPCRVRRTAGSVDHSSSRSVTRYDRGAGTTLGNRGHHSVHPDRPRAQVLQVASRALGHGRHAALNSPGGA